MTASHTELSHRDSNATIWAVDGAIIDVTEATEAVKEQFSRFLGILFAQDLLK